MINSNGDDDPTVTTCVVDLQKWTMASKIEQQINKCQLITLTRAKFSKHMFRQIFYPGASGAETRFNKQMDSLPGTRSIHNKFVAQEVQT